MGIWYSSRSRSKLSSDGTRALDPLAARGIWSLIGLMTWSLNASAPATIFDFFTGFGSFISGESTSSYRMVYTLKMACRLAVIGSARNAPNAPNTPPNTSTARNATAGFRSMVRWEIFGERIRFSICW